MGTILHMPDREESTDNLRGSCFIVGAPIEERDDITQRAIRVLQSVDLVITSNDRYAAGLLKRFALSKRLLGISEEIENDVVEITLEALSKEKRIAILSDPSFRFSIPISNLIAAVRDAGLEPRVIPGVDLVATALAMSGFDSQSYSVVGVLPARREARDSFVGLLTNRPETIVVPGGTSRIQPSLLALAGKMPNREATLILRPTVPGETIMRGTLSSIAHQFANKRFNGHYIIVLAPDFVEESDQQTSYKRSRKYD